jgi:hypothetical protein
VCATTLPSELSDHTPILIKSGVKPKTQPIFRFENCWFLRPDLQEIIKRVWVKTYLGDKSIDIWQKRFECLRKTLKGWKKHHQRRGNQMDPESKRKGIPRRG